MAEPQKKRSIMSPGTLSGDTPPKEPRPRTGLLEPEYAEAWEGYVKQPNPANASKILQAVTPVMNNAFRTYARTDTPGPAIRAHAKRIVLDALPRYDPDRAKLQTHLLVQLQGLQRYAARSGQVIRLPERVALDAYHLHNGSRELADRLGREPSDQELSDHLGMSLKRMAHVRQAKPPAIESHYDPTQNEWGSRTQAPGVVQSDREENWRNFVYHDLHPTDQLIMEHVLGMNGKPQLAKKDIAVKLKISPSAVSQRLARIQALLDRRDDFESQLF